MLHLPNGFPTDHITWASRGWGDSEAALLEEQGFDPVSAPGACEGRPYSAGFRRKAAGLFAVKGAAGTGGDHLCFEICRAVASLGRTEKRWPGMFSSASETIYLLDGQLYSYAADYGFSGSPTLDLYGNHALRLVCHRLGLRQPRQFPDEESVPSMEQLETELLEELRNPPPLPDRGVRVYGAGSASQPLNPPTKLVAEPEPTEPLERAVPGLDHEERRLVESLFDCHSLSEFMIIVQESDLASFDGVLDYLDYHHPDSGIASQIRSLVT
jgi:hypothetical protein